MRTRNIQLLWNTLGLVLGVQALTTAIALPMAWLTSRVALPFRRAFTIAAVLPLAIPAYLMAYAWLSLGGNWGITHHLFGINTPRLSGYFGSLLVLSLYSYPYLYLNLRTAFLGLNPSTEEAARSLGLSPWQAFWRITLPELRPAYGSGVMLVVLHTLGDFAVVSLMRYETFGYALYSQYLASYDRAYLACLSLLLLLLVLFVLLVDYIFLRGVRVQEFAPTGVKRRHLITLPAQWKVAAYALLSFVPALGVVVPLAAICYWLTRYSQTSSHITEMLPALWHSVSASAMAALLCTALAFPIVYLTTRFASVLSRTVERIVYFGYAVPAFVFALGMLFFVLRTFPALYQGLAILVLAYALRFLAEATGPLRSALLQASPRVEEAARSLGCDPRQAFRRVTFPLVRRGIIVSMAFIFLACMKELPVTFILSPPGYDTLAVSAWGHIDDAGFAEAAPFALAIFIFSALFVGLLLREEKQ